MISNYTKLATFNKKGVTQFLVNITLFTCFKGAPFNKLRVRHNDITT